MGTSFINNKGFLTTDLNTPEYFRPVHKEDVLKYLVMKRQRWSCSQEDNSLEDNSKRSRSKPDASSLSSHLLGDFAPVNSSQPAPETHIPRQPMQHAATLGQLSPNEVKLSLFHWQINQEEQKVGEVSPDLLNMQDADGDTCLHIAVAQGRRATAYVLAAKMSRCGSLELKEHKGQTALHLAVATNQHMIVHDLLLHGAQINTIDLWGRSPLHVCAEKGHSLSLQSICKTLMGRGPSIDIEMFNYDGLTPLHVASLLHNAVVRELSRENPCLNATMALEHKKKSCIECIKILLLMGASSGSMDLKSGRTCLHIASEQANLELISMFLCQPYPLTVINVKTYSGNTALHIVSSLQNHKFQVEAVKMLMRNGADPGSKNLENEMPSQLVPHGPIGEKVRQILKGRYFHA